MKHPPVPRKEIYDRSLDVPKLLAEAGVPLSGEDVQETAKIMEIIFGHDKLARMPGDVLEEIFRDYLQKWVHIRFVGVEDISHQKAPVLPK